MTQLLGLPGSAEVAARTPAGRDRAIDVVRIVSLIGVVAGHTVMATSMIRDNVLIWDNLLATSTVFQALTWIFQIMPLFFFAGAAACLQSWRTGASWGGWLLKRCIRLYRPVFYYLVFWAFALVAQRCVLPEHVYRPVAGISIQLLWFVGAYVLVLATMPMLDRIHTATQFTAGAAGVYVFVAIVDIIRLHSRDATLLGYTNMVAWVIPAMFGVAYRRGLFTRRAMLATGLILLGVNLLLCRYGPYELSLVGIENQRLANMAPPSLLLAGHAIALCALTVVAAPAIARWARRPRVWWLTAIGNSGAMTLYLWHLPALLGMHLAFDYLGWPRFPGHPRLVLLSVLQLVLVAGLIGVLFVALRPLENSALPGWDGAIVTVTGPRSATIGVLVCFAAASTLVSVKWGLTDGGLYCVAAMLAALAAARVLVAGAVSASRGACRTGVQPAVSTPPADR